MKKIFLFLLVFMTFLSVKSQSLDSLKNVLPTGYVNDYQNLLTPEQKDTLERMMSDYEKKTSIEFCLVTYYINPENYFSGDVIKLAEKWGVGKDNLNNGFLMFLSFSNEKGKSNYFNATGYGLEPFLPDGKLNQLESEIYPNTLYQGNIYEAYKQYIKACQEVLGDDGYDMLVKNKEIEDAKTKAAVKAFFTGLFQLVLILLVLSGIGYIIYLRYKKRKEFLQLKSEIENIINKINSLRSKFSNIHQSTVDKICNNVLVKVTNKLVTNETKNSMNYIYNQLLDYRQVVNTIDNTLDDIKKSMTDIELYSNNNYPYCAEYLRSELKEINKMFELKSINYKSTDYNRTRMNSLVGFQTSLDGKIRNFLSKSNKIYSIVNDYNNINKKIDELKTSYIEYNKKKTILSSAKIGKRYNSLVNIDFEDHILKLKNNILTSKEYLNKGDFEKANLDYATYITTLAVITGAFGSVDSLYSEYNNSVSKINREKSKLDSLISDVDNKINRSGVSYSRKSTYSSIKDDISKYNKLKDIDVIAASLLLGTIISNLDDVYYKIKSDISDYNRPSYSSSSSSYSSSSSSYSSGGSSFGGFGGGSFGGGGSGGSF